MSKWKIWLGLVVVFASGVLIGSVGTRLYLRHRITQVMSGERPFFKNMFLVHLTREIELTNAQREAVERIADRASVSFRSLRKEHRGDVEAIFDQAVLDMKEHLSPDQQKEMDALYERMKKLHRHRRHSRHPPPPGIPPNHHTGPHPPPYPPPEPPPGPAGE